MRVFGAGFWPVSMLGKPRRGYRQCSKCEKNRQERFFTGPRGRICSTCRKASRSKATHETRVQATYGLGPGEWDKLLAAQEGVCAICGRKPRYRPDVDHSHATNVIRGLLCKPCNRRLLPAAKDDPEILRRAAEYLENPPATKHLGERFYSK